VPSAVDVILWLVLAAVFESAVFTQDFARSVYFQGPAMRLLLIVGVVRLVLAAWSLVIFIIALSEVQGFSIFKAILNTLIAIFFVVAVVWIVCLLTWWLQGFIQR
jgi:hypothetical protein